MAIKAEINSEQVLKYPWIGKANNGDIVLFSEKQVGVLLKNSVHYEAGYYSRSWQMNLFTPLTCSITLSNEN